MPELKYQAIMEELSFTTFVKEHGELLYGVDIVQRILDGRWNATFIIDAFTWRNTPEGLSYWKAVFESKEALSEDAQRRLQQMLDEFILYTRRKSHD